MTRLGGLQRSELGVGCRPPIHPLVLQNLVGLAEFMTSDKTTQKKKHTNIYSLTMVGGFGIKGLFVGPFFFNPPTHKPEKEQLSDLPVALKR